MNPRAVRWWQWAISGTLCVFVALYARAVPWSTVAHNVASASPRWIVLGTCAFLLGVVVRGVLWWVFLREVGAPSVVLAVRGVILVTALHNVVVANAGEAGRVLLLTRRSRATGADVIATIALERLIVTSIHVAMSLGVGLIAPLPESLARWRVVLLVGLASIAVAVTMLSRSGGSAAAPARGIRGRVHRVIAGVALTFRRISSPQRVATAVVLGVVWWFLNLALFHWTALAMGFGMPLSASAVAFLMVSAGSIAHATPGNVGVLQVAYAGAAHMLGFPVDEAIGVAVVVQALQALPIMLVSLPIVWDMFAAWRER